MKLLFSNLHVSNSVSWFVVTIGFMYVFVAACAIYV